MEGGFINQKFTPHKKFGQHFLKDSSIVHKIIAASSIKPADNILEIGGGPGALTKELLRASPHHLTVIEIDKQFWPHLRQLAPIEKLTLLQSDALRVDLLSLEGCPLKIIANLPYNIGTQLIINWLKEKSLIKTMILMLQKEVVDRICAGPRTKDYGRLSILVQSQCQVQKLFNVAPGCFSPPPAVMSTVVQITPLDKTYDPSYLEKLTHLVFQQRRKMLRVSLNPLNIPNLEVILEKVEVEPTARPEELSVETFIRLSKVLENYLKL